METYTSPIKKGRKLEGDNDDDVAHVAALLTEASQRGGSPQVTQKSYRRPVHMRSSVQSSERMVHNMASLCSGTTLALFIDFSKLNYLILSFLCFSIHLQGKLGPIFVMVMLLGMKTGWKVV